MIYWVGAKLVLLKSPIFLRYQNHMDKKNSSDTHCSIYIQVFGKAFQRHKNPLITMEEEKIHECINGRP